MSALGRSWLQRFVGTDESRPYLMQVHAVSVAAGEVLTYTTNGHVAAFLPGNHLVAGEQLDDVTAPERYREKLLEMWRSQPEPSAWQVIEAAPLRAWLGLRPLDVPADACGACSGRLTVSCDECFGTGDTSCSCAHCGDDHRADCDSCDGLGYLPCEGCIGVRKKITVERGILFGALLNRGYLRAVLHAPRDTTIRFAPPPSALSPAWLAGEGWVAVVMPMRPIRNDTTEYPTFDLAGASPAAGAAS